MLLLTWLIPWVVRRWGDIFDWVGNHSPARMSGGLCDRHQPALLDQLAEQALASGEGPRPVDQLVVQPHVAILNRREAISERFAAVL